MAEFETKILIHEKLSKVWEVFMDDAQQKKWNSGLKTKILLSGKNHSRGSRYELTYGKEGKNAVLTEEIQEVIKNKRYASTFENDDIKMYQEVNFHARGYSTEIVSYLNAEGKGFKAKLKLSVSKGKWRKKQEQDFQKLKKLIEKKK